MNRVHLTLAALLAGLAAFPAIAGDSPAEVVLRFNEAVTARDMDTAMAQLADGSVQIQLRAAHPGMSSNPPLTADLHKNWEMVGAILFPTTDAYSRELTITSEQLDGDIATVWADTVTTTHRKNVAEPMVLEFSELYLLVKKEGRWKIAACADNRQPDTIQVSAAN